jgi:hypothetical protein
MISIVVGMFVCFLIGLIFGGHYGVDSCSDDIKDAVILKHVKEYVIHKESLDKDEMTILHQLISTEI